MAPEQAPASVLVPGLALALLVPPCLVWAPAPVLPQIQLPPAVALTPGLALALKPSWAPALMNPILAPAKAPAAVAVHPPVYRQPKEPMFQVFPLFLKINFLLVVIPKSLTPGNLGVEEIQHILRYVLPQ